MSANLGWRPAEIAEAEWWSVADLLAWWQDHPPVAELVAAYMGVKPKATPVEDIPLYPIPGGMTATPPPANDDPGGISELIRRFPDGVLRF